MYIQSYYVGIPTDAVANEQRLRRGDRVSYPAFQVSIKGSGKIFFLSSLTA